MRWLSYRVLWVVLALLLLAPQPAAAYSVLAHEAIVDAAWDDGVVPFLKRRFPAATDAELLQARAYAYGGAIIQDLGYFPFGSKLFTNLVHYVRGGDFVESLVREATTLNELAFAAGAMAHHASDNAGHPIAVNRAIPLIYPKDRDRYGQQVLYVQAPKHHLMTEFAFDVLQVARGGYAADAYHAFVGFAVAEDVLERAFKRTYGLDLEDLFADLDLAIGTYRWAVGTTIPEMTRIAWREKHDEIERATPGVPRDAFLYDLQRREFEQQFGTKYRKPGLLSRMLAFIIRIVPKVGPLRPFAFRPLTPEAERLFLDSTKRAATAYLASLRDAANGRLALANTDFDTGEPLKPGVNPLADETLRDLASKIRESRAALATADAR